MKVRMKMGLSAWIWLGSQLIPSQRRSMFSAWSTQEEPLWSKSAQKTATKT